MTRGPRLVRRTPLRGNRFVEIYEAVLDFGDHRRTYTVSDYGERAGLLVLDRGRCLLVRQYRYLLGGPSWEIPGGRIEPGETPRRAAVRELREEAGLRCRSVRRLITSMPGTDTLANRTHVFLGEGPSPAPGAAGRPETDARRWVPADRVLAAIRRGRVPDVLTVNALLAWRVFSARGPAGS